MINSCFKIFNLSEKVPLRLVLSVPRILEVSPLALDFFETVVCGLSGGDNDHVQIKAVDVLAYFLLDEFSLGDYSEFAAFLSMVPKESLCLPFAWSVEELNAFDSEARKLIEIDLAEFNEFNKRITLYHNVIGEPFRWTRQELQWAYMTIQTR